MAKKQLSDGKYYNFKEKVYSDLSVYERRLKQIGCINNESVLDLGSGFGQWSIVMSKLNNTVYSLEFDEYGIEVQKKELKSRNISNIILINADMQNIPLKNESVDFIFAYSSIYFTDYKKVIKEITRVLKKGGKFYICVNSYGWYLKNIFDFRRDGYSTFLYGIKSFIDTISYSLLNKIIFHESIIVSKNSISKELLKNKLRIIHMKGEGKINITENESISFFKDKYFGIDSVYEILGKKYE